MDFGTSFGPEAGLELDIVQFGSSSSLESNATSLNEAPDRMRCYTPQVASSTSPNQAFKRCCRHRLFVNAAELRVRIAGERMAVDSI